MVSVAGVLGYRSAVFLAFSFRDFSRSSAERPWERRRPDSKYIVGVPATLSFLPRALISAMGAASQLLAAGSFLSCIQEVQASSRLGEHQMARACASAF